MKKNLHPPFVDCKVSCACGNTFMTKSTVTEIKTELCSRCHPFFTGEQVLIDTAGQVERFQKRATVAQQYQDKHAKKTKKEAPPKEEEREATAEELLQKIKQQLTEDAKKKEQKKAAAKKPKAK